jgi:hypothetical protein
MFSIGFDGKKKSITGKSSSRSQRICHLSPPSVVLLQYRIACVAQPYDRKETSFRTVYFLDSYFGQHFFNLIINCSFKSKKDNRKADK